MVHGRPLGFVFCFLFLCKNSSSCGFQLGVHFLQIEQTPSPTWESGSPTQGWIWLRYKNFRERTGINWKIIWVYCLKHLDRSLGYRDIAGPAIFKCPLGWTSWLSGWTGCLVNLEQVNTQLKTATAAVFAQKQKAENKTQRPYTITLNYLCVKYYFALYPHFL